MSASKHRAKLILIHGDAEMARNKGVPKNPGAVLAVLLLFTIVAFPAAGDDGPTVTEIPMSETCPSPEDTSLTNWTCRHPGSSKITDNSPAFSGNEADFSLYATCSDGFYTQEAVISLQCDDPSAFVESVDIDGFTKPNPTSKPYLECGNLNVCGDNNTSVVNCNVRDPSECYHVQGSSWGGSAQIDKFACVQRTLCLREPAYICVNSGDPQNGSKWNCDVKTKIDLDSSGYIGAELKFQCLDEYGNFNGTVQDVHLEDEDKVTCDSLDNPALATATKDCNLNQGKNEGSFKVEYFICQAPSS